MDCLPDAVVSAAAARVRHPCVDIGVGRIRTPLQQSECAHDHPGLAVAALWRIEFLPGDLDRMVTVRRDPFDGCYSFAHRHGRLDAAGSDRLTIDMHRARAALPDAAAKLRARQADVIPNHP